MQMSTLLRLVFAVNGHAKEDKRVKYTSKTKKNRLNRKSFVEHSGIIWT